MFTPYDTTPQHEISQRHEQCRLLMQSLCPDVSGLMVFSRLNIYYLTGTLAAGIFWLPRQGTPVLFVRKGIERAKLESPSLTVASYRSYGDLAPLLHEFGTTNLAIVACEKNGLPWAMADMLTKKLPQTQWVAGDPILSQARAIKSPWEMAHMEKANSLHNIALCQELPKRLEVGMTEREIAITLWDIFFSLGHPGQLRMSAFGEEQFQGAISVGNNGNYPSYFNGPVAMQGEHPATPVMGNRNIHWEKNMILTIDTGFAQAGYHSDKTQIFFSGSQNALPDMVKRAHQTCLEIEEATAKLLCTGAIPAHIYNVSLEMAQKAGFAEGFMALGANKVPFLGHAIGLTVDEWPVLANKFEDPLKKHMTFAIEPKIGLEGIGIVGTENVYEVTDNGGRCLSGKPEQIICIN